MSDKNLLHLGSAGTCDDRHRYSVRLQGCHELINTRDILEYHILFEILDHLRKFLLFLLHSMEILIENPRKGLSLYFCRERLDSEIFHSLLVPEGCVLRLGVHDHTVKIE